jgi:hypothetical protein
LTNSSDLFIYSSETGDMEKTFSGIVVRIAIIMGILGVSPILPGA